jgi:hypothetical protein
MSDAAILQHHYQAAMDWALASTLIGGAYAFHVDMAMVNSYVAFAGGILGVALGAARLYFFLSEKWNERDRLRDSVRDSARDFARDASRDSEKDAEMDRDR